MERMSEGSLLTCSRTLWWSRSAPAPVERVRHLVPQQLRSLHTQPLPLQGGVLQGTNALEGGLRQAPRHGAHLLLGEDTSVPPLAARLPPLLLVDHEDVEIPAMAKQKGVVEHRRVVEAANPGAVPGLDLVDAIISHSKP